MPVDKKAILKFAIIYAWAVGVVFFIASHFK